MLCIFLTPLLFAHISLTSLPRAPSPLPISYLLEDKRIQFSQFSVYWQKVKSTSHSMSLNSELWKPTRMNSCFGGKGGALKDKLLRNFLKQSCSGSHSPGNLSSCLHKIIHPSNSFKKERADGLFFFHVIDKHHSGGDFSGGVPAGHLDLGQAQHHCCGRIFSECNSFRSFFFRKECSCCSPAFPPCLCGIGSTVFSRIPVCYFLVTDRKIRYTFN